MNNLVLHCGGYLADYDAVRKVPTPQHTATHYPIPHHVLVDHVLGHLERQGLQVVQAQHALANQGQRYFGLMELETSNKAFALVVGLRNAHDMSVAARLGAGKRVFVCDNLGFSAEIDISRKHTRFISQDLERLTAEAVGRVTTMRVPMEQRMLAYQQAQFDQVMVDHLVVEFMRAKVISSQQVRKVIEEYEQPSHEEFLEYGESGWRLENATTEVLKGTNVFELPKRTMRLQDILDQACEVNFKEAA